MQFIGWNKKRELDKCWKILENDKWNQHMNIYSFMIDLFINSMFSIVAPLFLVHFWEKAAIDVKLLSK